MGGSVLICNFIRSNAKVTLRRKFDDLLSKSQNTNLRRYTHTASEHQASELRANNEPRNSRVTVLGGMSLTERVRY